MSDMAPDAKMVAAETQAVAKISTGQDGGQLVGRSSGTRKALFYTLLVLFSLLYIFPFIIQLVTSFKTSADADQHPLSLVPKPFTLDAMNRLFETNFPPVVRQFCLGCGHRHDRPGLLLLARWICLGALEVPGPQRSVHGDPRRDVGPRDRLAAAEVLGPEVFRDLQHPYRAGRPVDV